MLAFGLGASDADAIDHALQAGNEIVISSFGFALVTFKRLENDLDAVDGGENERDSLTRGRRAVAKPAHQRFGCMSERFEARQPKKPASAFDGMDQPEDVIENLRVVRILLKTHELDVDPSRLSFVSVTNSRSRSSIKNAFVDGPGPSAAFRWKRGQCVGEACNFGCGTATSGRSLTAR